MLKCSVNFAVLASTFLSASVGARVIYGEDGRKEVYEASAVHQMLARSTLSMVPVKKIIHAEDGSIQLSQTSLQDWFESEVEEAAPLMPALSQIKWKKSNDEEMKLRMCATERFIDQPNPSMCSSFLIAPDLIVTAGHCVQEFNACGEHKWVFDFKVDQETGRAGVSVKPEDIYSCKRIITKSLNMQHMTDFAIIQLDRKVEGRTPLEINFDDTIAVGAEVVVIGSPMGLPLKVIEGGKVRKNDHPMFFVTNVDTYTGSSGSAVFNVTTNLVEGILVRGEIDFTYNDEKECVESRKCADEGCRGEDVSRITSVPEVALKELMHSAAETGDTASLEKVLKLNIWVDFYGKDGQSSLIKAAKKAMNSSLVTLLSFGAEVNLTDADGNTALHHLAQVLTPENAESLVTLVVAGAKLDIKNNEGLTPLMVAEAAGNIEGLKLLVQAWITELRIWPQFETLP